MAHRAPRKLRLPSPSAVAAGRGRSPIATRAQSMIQSLYEAAGCADGILALAHAWHERVLADEVVAHAFSHGYRPDHTERLAAYWAEALGGPALYSGRHADESFVVSIHSGNGPHDEM